MKEITINIPDESSGLVIELVERLGGNVDIKEVKNKRVAKAKSSQKKVAQTPKKTKKEKIDHTYLFGKWKNLDIDARKLRERSW